MLKVGDWVRVVCPCSGCDKNGLKKAGAIFEIQGLTHGDQASDPANRIYEIKDRFGEIWSGYGEDVLVLDAFINAAKSAIQAAGAPAAPDAALAPEEAADSK